LKSSYNSGWGIVAEGKLGKVENGFLAQMKIKKMLAKVVCTGGSSMGDNRRLMWI
jgi:hypothetical protein